VRAHKWRGHILKGIWSFENASREELIQHALRALKDSLSQDKELSVDNTSVGVGGIDETFKLHEGQAVASWLETAFENKAEGGESMDVDE